MSLQKENNKDNGFEVEIDIPKIPFEKLNFLDRLKEKKKDSVDMINRTKEELQLEISEKQGFEQVPIGYLSETGNLHLCLGFKSETDLLFKSDKKHRKQLDEEQKITIYYPQSSKYPKGYHEEGYLCTPYHPSNIKVNTKFEKNLAPVVNTFMNASERLKGDLIRSKVIHVSRDMIEQQKMYLIAGGGIASFFWVAIIFVLSTM